MEATGAFLHSRGIFSRSFIFFLRLLQAAARVIAWAGIGLLSKTSKWILGEWAIEGWANNGES